MRSISDKQPTPVPATPAPTRPEPEGMMFNVYCNQCMKVCGTSTAPGITYCSGACEAAWHEAHADPVAPVPEDREEATAAFQCPACDNEPDPDGEPCAVCHRAEWQAYIQSLRDLAAAWRVVEQKRADGWCYQIAETEPGEVVCWFFRGGVVKGRIPGMTAQDAPMTPYHRGVAATVPLAIRAAALAAVPEHTEGPNDARATDGELRGAENDHLGRPLHRWPDVLRRGAS